jgi:lipopolysaccharide biosynthesis glycosyltransferase/glycosyltransferase involved in cell wall biosynthesis
MDKKKIAIIVQRYGEEVCGGGEYYAKKLAEHLAGLYAVEVLTTTSLEYMSWDNHYEAGSSVINGVVVTRFAPEHERDWDVFNKISVEEYRKIKSNIPTDLRDDCFWTEAEGPYCPTLIEYLEKHKDEYDVVFVITYIYYTAIRAIPVIRDKCVFLPTAHDEDWIRLTIFKKIFSMPRYFAFLTEGEKNFVHNYFHNTYIPCKVVGFGVDIPETSDVNSFRKKYHVKAPYLVYVGRIDVSKGCDQMISSFLQYKKMHRNELKLVLIGEKIIDVPSDKDIIVTGFVSEEDKFNGIMGAEAMICPSKYESLCIALLEGMACGKPVLVNKECPILAEQCEKSKAGFAYANADEFAKYIDQLICDRKLYKNACENALEFIKKYYTWDSVTKNFIGIIEKVSAEKAYDRNIFDASDMKEFTVAIDNLNQTVEPAFKNNAVAVCFISSDEFAPLCGVALYSLIKNTSEKYNYDILILCSDISSYNMQLFHSMAEDRKNISVRFINLQAIVRNYHYQLASYYNEFTYYRLFIPQICRKYDKVLYLDSDVIVNHDVAELYNTNLGDSLLAGTRELTVLCWQLLDEGHGMKKYLNELGLNNVGGYIQGGVELYNISKFNDELPADKLIKASTQKKYLMADQDIINIYCKGKILILPNKWNVVNMDLDNSEICELYSHVLPDTYFDEYAGARKDPYIVHYSGQRIPCFKPNVDLYHYFWQYARETPFYEYLLSRLLPHIGRNADLPSGQVCGQKVVNQAQQVGEQSLIWRAANKVLPYGSRRRELVKKIIPRDSPQWKALKYVYHKLKH